MFSNEKKDSFNNKDFTMSNFVNNSKFKLSQLNDTKWINYLLLEITIFQLFFFGLFSIISIILVTLQIFLFYKIYNLLKTFPVFESSEIDRICCEIGNIYNFVQFTFLINILEFFLFIFDISYSIGKEDFVGLFIDKFVKISIIISLMKIFLLYLIRIKINKANMRAEIINNQ